MQVHVGKDIIAPVIAVALDQAWGDRYGEHAVEELAVESNHIANALLRDFTVTLPEDEPLSRQVPPLDDLPVNTCIKVLWSYGGRASVLRKIKDREPGVYSAKWDSVSDNTGEHWADWEIELVAHSAEIIALGVNHD